MLFTFKRDEEGRETVHVNNTCIAVLSEHVKGRVDIIPATVAGLQEQHVHDAIERADEAGFWLKRKALMGPPDAWVWSYNAVTVDVPVADNAVLSVTVGGDES